MAETPDKADDGRDETEEERSDRNLVELLQEVRVVQTGVQILFGFLLTIAFQPKFEKLSSFQKGVYLGTLVAAATTLLMLTAPISWHRILFRQHDKEHLVEIANRFTLMGLASMGVTTIGVVLLLSDVAFPTWLTALVTAVAVIACSVFWYAMPLARRRALGLGDSSAAPDGGALGGGSSLSDPHRLDSVLPDRLDPDREAVR